MCEDCIKTFEDKESKFITIYDRKCKYMFGYCDICKLKEKNGQKTKIKPLFNIEMPKVFRVEENLCKTYSDVCEEIEASSDYR